MPFGIAIRRVAGNSMAPTLKAGAIIIVRRKPLYHKDDVVVFLMNKTEMVKRISDSKNGKYYMRGDNPDDSFDSRHYGAVSHDAIIGSTMTKKSKSKSSSKLPEATPAPKLIIPKLAFLPLILAAVNGVMAVIQLATYTEFATAIRTYSIATSDDMTRFIAVTLVALEILSIPVLLRLSLSRAMRILSAIAVTAAPSLWLTLVLIAHFEHQELYNYGMFGSVFVVSGDGLIVVKTILYTALSLIALQVLGAAKLFKRNTVRTK